MSSQLRHTVVALVGFLPLSARAQAPEDPAQTGTDDAAAAEVSPPEAPESDDSTAGPELHQRLSLGVYGEQSLTSGDAGVDLVLDERLRASVDLGSMEGEVRLAGRLVGGLTEYTTLSRSRVREASLALAPGDWELLAGRFTPKGGGYHLADGLQVLHRAGSDWRVGAWLGTAPDPYTTLPAPRFGGGPVLSFERQRVVLDLGSELLVAAGGVDRAALYSAVRLDPSRAWEVGGRLDLQVVEYRARPRIAEVQATTRWSPTDALTVDAYYDAYSSAVYLRTEDRDPVLTRYADRWAGLEQDWVSRGVDDAIYHAVGGGVDHRFALGQAWAPTLQTGLRARGRISQRGATGGSYVRVYAGLPDAMDGRVDARLEQQVLSYGGGLDFETLASLWFDAVPAAGLSLDSSVQVGWRQLESTGKIAPSTWADLYVDWLLSRQLQLAAGYRFGNSLDRYEWDTSQALMARITWRESR